MRNSTRTSHATTWARVGAMLAAGSLIAMIPSVSAYAADNHSSIDFGTMSLGDPKGQQGWGSHTSRTYDFEIVDQGGHALRLSNSTDVVADYQQMSQLFAPRLVLPAGESSTGAVNDVFEMSFTIESTTGALQPGLNISVAVSGERSDGNQPQNRAGGLVNISHTTNGLEVWTTWPAEGDALSDWRNAGTVVSANQSHTVRYVAQFVDGDDNDTASLWVDGVLVSDQLSTWENYHDVAEAFAKQTVEGPLFRINSSHPTTDGIGYASGVYPADPSSLDGEGLLVRNLSYSTYRSVPTAPPAPTTVPPAETAGMDADATPGAGGTVSFEATGFDPFENVAITVYSTPYFAGWFRADANGVLSGTLTLPSSIGSGNHVMAFAGENGNAAQAGFAYLAATGAPETTALVAGAAGLLLLAGIAVLVLRRRTRARRG